MDVTPDGFSWIDANDASGNVLSFLRNGVDADGHPVVMACIANFSGTPKPDYRVGLPFAGRWREVLNTDAQAYGGSGVGNLGAVEAEPACGTGGPRPPCCSCRPSGVLWLAPEPFDGTSRTRASVAEAIPAAPEPVSTAIVVDAEELAAEDDLDVELPDTDPLDTGPLHAQPTIARPSSSQPTSAEPTSTGPTSTGDRRPQLRRRASRPRTLSSSTRRRPPR